MCDKSNAALSHPPDLMLDYNVEDSSPNFTSYWQSVSWNDTRVQPQVNVTLSFGRRYVMEDNIIVTFKSARPQRMLLEKSVDQGLTWTVLQYYDANCKQTIDDRLAVRMTSREYPDAVICTEAFSTQYPYTDGQVCRQTARCDYLFSSHIGHKFNRIIYSVFLFENVMAND